MDDQALGLASAPREYRCPGQPHAIDRAAHLARLAAFYPECLRCPHRDDTQGLSTLQRRAWAEIERRARAGPRLGGEAIEGTANGDVDPQLMRRVASALAGELWHHREGSAAGPVVLVGSDGSWASADLMPAACGLLAEAGCRALEVGAVTSPALATAAHRAGADAALWVGNASGAAHACHVKLWREGGRPASSPGALARVWAGCDAPLVRPKRRGGGLDRCDAEAAYLPTLEGLHHGLRPLVFVLATTCEVLVRYWRKLCAESACRVVRARRDALARQVVIEGAHFGLWIDGDGEACTLVDERGSRVDGEAFFLALCGYVCHMRPAAAVVLEPGASATLERAVERLGARVVRGAATRQDMGTRMEESDAAVGGGVSGRHWYSGPPAAGDALLTLSLLVSLLSQSDRPVSEVLDLPTAAG